MSVNETQKSTKSAVSRRGFMASAGAAAGVAVATTYSPFSYAKNEKVMIGAIGTGGQGSFHVRDGLSRAKNIQIKAICDVYTPHRTGGLKAAGNDPSVGEYVEYKEMLQKEDIDAVMIATPLHTHHQIAMDCLDAGKYVFCEKTMCYEIEHCRDLVKKVHETGKFLQVGHQRRYNPTYNHALKLAWKENVIGRINHIDAQWHRNNDWRRPVDTTYQLSEVEKKYIKDLERHINWRLYRASSGGLMTELATHALDIVNWFLDANPTKVVGFGGLDYWHDGREVFDNINVTYEYEIGKESGAFKAIEPRTKLQNDYKDELQKPYTVRVVYSSITGNGQRGASEWIQGDEGTMKLTELGSLYYREPGTRVKWAEKGEKDAAAANAIKITSGASLGLSNKAQDNADPLVVDTDKSVDQLQFESFANDIKTGGTPRANVMVGLKSAVCALTGMKAMRDAEKGGSAEVKIDPKYYEFDFETDNSSMYGPVLEV